MADDSESPRNSSEEFAESSPLLAGQPRRPEHRPTLSVTSIASVHVPKVHKSGNIVNLLCVITLIATSASGFVAIPQARLVEDVICRQYYDVEGLNVPIDEELCKEDTIQSKLAFILAMTTAFDAIVGFLAAFPWGLVADRIGRKPVVTIALSGLLCNLLWQMTVLYFHNVFPTQLVWLASAGNLIGGGNPLLVGVLLSMITDATHEEDRAIAFMRIHVASLCGNLLSPALSSLMMGRTGPWPPVWVAVGLLIVTAIAFLFIPETMKQPKQAQEAEQTEGSSGMKSRVSHVMGQFRESLSILQSPSLILLMLTALGWTPVTFATLQFMAQFISKRYQMKLSQTGYVQSVFGVAQIIQALVILPWLLKFVMKRIIPTKMRPIDERHRDLSVARWSYAILFVGVVILGLAPTLPGFIFGLVLMALGSGFSSIVRSLLSLYVDPEHRSRLFSLVSMVEVLGSVYAQPMLAGLFTLGMKLGGGAIGLPYYGLSVITATAGVLLLFVRIPKTRQDSPEPSHNEHGDQQG